MKTWTHPGGKLRELGAESLTDAELLAIPISTGTKGKTAYVCGYRKE
jgi:DNA repair protein RadC